MVAYLDLRSVGKLWLIGDRKLQKALSSEIVAFLPSEVGSPLRRHALTWPSLLSNFPRLKYLNLRFNPRYSNTFPLPSTVLPETAASLVSLSVPHLDEKFDLAELVPSLTHLSVARVLHVDLTWAHGLPHDLQSLDAQLSVHDLTRFCMLLPRSLSRLNLIIFRATTRATDQLDTRVLPPGLTYLSITDSRKNEYDAWSATDLVWPHDSVEALEPLTPPQLTVPASSSSFAGPFASSSSSSSFPSLEVFISSLGPHATHLPPDLLHLTLLFVPTWNLAEMPLRLPSKLTSLDLGAYAILFECSPRLVARRQIPVDAEALISPDTSHSGLPLITSASHSTSSSSSHSYDFTPYKALSPTSVRSSYSSRSAHSESPTSRPIFPPSSLLPPRIGRRRSRSSSAYSSVFSSSSTSSQASISSVSIASSLPDAVPSLSRAIFTKPPVPTSARRASSSHQLHLSFTSPSPILPHPRPRSSSSSGGSRSSHYSSSERSSSSPHSSSSWKHVTSPEVLGSPATFSGVSLQYSTQIHGSLFRSHSIATSMLIDEAESQGHVMEGLEPTPAEERSISLSPPFSTPRLVASTVTHPPPDQRNSPPANPVRPRAHRSAGSTKFTPDDLPPTLIVLHGKLASIDANALQDLPSGLKVLGVLPTTRTPLRDNELQSLPEGLEVLHLHLLRATQLAYLPKTLTHLSSSLDYSEIRWESSFSLGTNVPPSLKRLTAPDANPSATAPLLPPPLVSSSRSWLSSSSYSISASISPSRSSSGATGAVSSSVGSPFGRSRSGTSVSSPHRRPASPQPSSLSAMDQDVISDTNQNRAQDWLPPARVLEDDEIDEVINRRRRPPSNAATSSLHSSRESIASNDALLTESLPTEARRRLPRSIAYLECRCEDLGSLSNLPADIHTLTVFVDPRAHEIHLSSLRNLEHSKKDLSQHQMDVEEKSVPRAPYMPTYLNSLTKLTLDIPKSVILDSLFIFSPTTAEGPASSPASLASSDSTFIPPALEYLKIVCKDEITLENSRFFRHLPPGLLDLIVEYSVQIPKLPVPRESRSSSALFSRTSSPTIFSLSSSTSSLTAERSIEKEIVVPWLFHTCLPIKLQSLCLTVVTPDSETHRATIKVSPTEVDALPEALVFLSMPSPCKNDYHQIVGKLRRMQEDGLEYQLFTPGSMYYD